MPKKILSVEEILQTIVRLIKQLRERRNSFIIPESLQYVCNPIEPVKREDDESNEDFELRWLKGLSYDNQENVMEWLNGLSNKEVSVYGSIYKNLNKFPDTPNNYRVVAIKWNQK